MSDARAPDYNLAMLVGDQRNPSVGSGWSQTDGSISIKLHPGVVLTASDKMRLRLFPKDFVPNSARKPAITSRRAPSARFDHDDDIPF